MFLTRFVFFVCSSYKAYGQSSQYKFGILTKIVKYIRARHQDGDDHPLTIDELLDETNQLDVGAKVKTVNRSNNYNKNISLKNQYFSG